jgi:hypothetical protein
VSRSSPAAAAEVETGAGDHEGHPSALLLEPSRRHGVLVGQGEVRLDHTGPVFEGDLDLDGAGRAERALGGGQDLLRGPGRDPVVRRSRRPHRRGRWGRPVARSGRAVRTAARQQDDRRGGGTQAEGQPGHPGAPSWSAPTRRRAPRVGRPHRPKARALIVTAASHPAGSHCTRPCRLWRSEQPSGSRLGLPTIRPGRNGGHRAGNASEIRPALNGGVAPVRSSNSGRSSSASHAPITLANLAVSRRARARRMVASAGTE